MFLTCRKCDNKITDDLYQSRDWESYKYELPEDYPASDDDDITIDLEYRVRQGTFMLYRHANKHYKKIPSIKPNDYMINPDNLLCKEQLAFKSGNGCCGNSWVEFFCPCCQTEIGEQCLDCWQNKHVRFFETKVNRSYKKIMKKACKEV